MIKKTFVRIIGLLIAIGGFVLLSSSGITGAAIGARGATSNFKTVAGIFLLFIGATAFAAAFKQLSLEDIIQGHTTRKFRKSAVYLGKKIFEKGKGSSVRILGNEDEAYAEVFNVIKMEASTGKPIPRLSDYQKIYHREKIDIPELGLKEAITYDAKALKTPGTHRGEYRYVFDKNGKYLGVAYHTKGQRGYRYKWA